MKELTIEEKAKRYGEALEKSKILYEQGTITESLCYVFPELKESEDERIRKELIDYFSASHATDTFRGIPWDKVVAWLEKQGEHANFRNKIQVGDKVTRNEDGILVNLSQLKRVAKPMEKQGEQKASYTTIVETGNGGINALVTRELHTNGEQKPAWSKEDEEIVEALNDYVKNLDIFFSEIKIGDKVIISKEFRGKVQPWLKSLKDRVQPKQEWKQENTCDLTDFENAMMHIGESFFGKNAGLDPNDTNTIRKQANLLLELVPNKEWSEEDENHVKSILSTIECCRAQFPNAQSVVEAYNADIEWFISLKKKMHLEAK